MTSGIDWNPGHKGSFRTRTIKSFKSSVVIWFQSQEALKLTDNKKRFRRACCVSMKRVQTSGIGWNPGHKGSFRTRTIKSLYHRLLWWWTQRLVLGQEFWTTMKTRCLLAFLQTSESGSKSWPWGLTKNVWIMGRHTEARPLHKTKDCMQGRQAADTD